MQITFFHGVVFFAEDTVYRPRFKVIGSNGFPIMAPQYVANLAYSGAMLDFTNNENAKSRP